MATSISAFLPSLSSTDGAVLTLGSAWLLYLLLTRKEGIPHPPGPRALPLVGNMFQIPQKDEWPIYEAWAKKYGGGACETFQINALITISPGPITYLTMLGTPMIVLNSLKAIRELMEERAAIYSNRPLMAMKEL